MRFLFTAPAIAGLVAALMCLLVALLSWQRRSIPGAAAFSLMMCAVFVWTASSGLSAGLVDREAKIFFAVVGYFGSANVAPLFLIFALRYRNHSWWPQWWQAALLWLVPAATLALVVTHRMHGLIWTTITASPAAGSNLLVFGHGPWFYVAVAYYAGLGVVAAFIIGRTALRAQRIFIAQTVILLAGLLVPWIASIIYIIPDGPFPGLDLPPIAFSITGLLITVGMRRLHLFNIVPVARDLLVERMADGIIVLNAQDRVVDVNPVARTLLGGADDGGATDVLGRSAGEVLGPLRDVLASCRAQGVEHSEVSLPGDSARYIDVGVLPLLEKDGSPCGTLLVIHDLTERRRMELEREKLITDLRNALGDIKALSGLLPICASCKKIRDDKGYWRNLEKYISDHSEAQFSHSLCPDCIRKLYPELLDKSGEFSA
jgi:hypothetical protein